jgi:hypothetical protein
MLCAEFIKIRRDLRLLLFCPFSYLAWFLHGVALIGDSISQAVIVEPMVALMARRHLLDV